MIPATNLTKRRGLYNATIAAAPVHPVDAMLQCHDRIRQFLSGAGRLAALADPLDARAPEAAVTCARYFRLGLPLHALDEDCSLGPRLRPLAPAAVGEALEQLAEGHERIHAALDTLLPDLDAIALGGPVPGHLAAAVDALAELFAPHLQLEEELIFPTAWHLLDAAAIEEIRWEMARRRR